MLDYEELMITISPPPLKANGSMASWYKWILKITFFISCAGIAGPIAYILNVLFRLILNHDFQPDWILTVNLIVIFIVSTFAIFAYRYDNRSSYYPMLAYLWFIKYGSISTLAHHLAIMCARSYTTHAEEDEHIMFEMTMIYISIPVLLITVTMHYIYYVVYKTAPMFQSVSPSESMSLSDL